jgi:hypothetical protein
VLNQPVSYKNPAAKALNVTYVAFVPKDKSAEERAQDRQELAACRGPRLDDPHLPRRTCGSAGRSGGVATLIEESIHDHNKAASPK